MEMFYIQLISGLLVGILFGFVLQRGRFCMNSAIRDIVLMKDYKLIKSVALALLTCMFGFGFMGLVGMVTFNPKSLTLFGSILGGFVFGLGMVLAAGCASGTTYRVGEGMMGSLVALLGLALGAAATGAGTLSGLKSALQSINYGPVTLFGALTKWTPLFSLILGILGLGATFYFWVLKEIKAEREEFFDFSDMSEKIFKKGWSWYTTGYLVGLINIIAWPLSAAAGRNYPLGITAGWAGNLKFLTTTTTDSPTAGLSWISWLVIGVILGAMIASMIAGEFKLRTPRDGKTILLQLVGGFIMGFGATVAMGCNIGNLLSGIPQLSLGSIVASIGIVLGCWLMAFLLFREKDE